MRDRPLLCVLDEPTAALDAETEHSLFERFAAAARDGVTSGRITVLVSHRFSTVRMADLIVVLDGAHMVESGSHDELMAKHGLYAELYGIQASLSVTGALELSRVDPRHPSGPALDLVVHVRGTARPVAAAAVPQADEAHLVHAARESACTAATGCSARTDRRPRGSGAELVGHDADRTARRAWPSSRR